MRGGAAVVTMTTERQAHGGKAAYCRDPGATGVAVGEERP
jgi:hypothetical protein